MRSHTTVGDEIVTSLDFPWDIHSVVRYHHERYDGNGYPDGLSGEDIPLTARIVSIADAYDAITTERTYQRARTHEEAFRILENERGARFDPELVAQFKEAMEERCAEDKAA